MLHYKGYDISTRPLHARGPAVSETAYIVRRGETVVHRGTVRGPFYSEGVAHFAAEDAAREWIDRSRQVRGPLPVMSASAVRPVREPGSDDE